MMFDSISEIVCFNAKYLMQKKGLLVGDVEKQIGKAVGYFSRNRISNSEMTIDTVYRLAKILDVSVDDLCSDIKLKDIKEYLSELGYKVVRECQEKKQ